MVFTDEQLRPDVFYRDFPEGAIHVNDNGRPKPIYGGSIYIIGGCTKCTGGHCKGGKDQIGGDQCTACDLARDLYRRTCQGAHFETATGEGGNDGGAGGQEI